MPSQPVPSITTAQMIEVDRLMIETYHINLIQMMENAGRCLAILSRKLFLSHRDRAKVVVMAGTGGNGGGGMVCARRLANWGYDVRVMVSSSRMAPVPQHQMEILQQMGVPVTEMEDLQHPIDLIIDGLIGYSVKGAPRGQVKEMIDWINRSAAKVISLDTPSGVDLTSGVVYHPVVKADATMTLALPKKGLFARGVRAVSGPLYLADLSVPPGLYRQPSLDINVDPGIFRDGDIVKLH
ncbi:MAG: NAD(P)H-hydrate epimerase [Bacteroidota bacterium]